ncbi:MAG TPA: 6-phosphogluconolactonase [Solirubrobacteraceae bacterium]|nr:6-phosphogluconolactonase [Solirubrobacteraceae bacterium]
MTRLTTCADAEGASQRTAAEVARLLASALRERGVAHLALSGGSTPARAYALLAREVEHWEGVEVWFADERCVPPDDDESNYKLARQTLFAEATGLTDERIHRIEGELGPLRAARRYGRALRARVAPAAGSLLPALDVIVLGIGPDGHVASLFPGAATLRASARSPCLGVRNSPKPPPERVTLSLPVLRAARRCVMLATGSSKADAVTRMLGRPTRHVPASLLLRERLSVFVDDAASPSDTE